ncbi:MAG: hypothetical protein Q7S34_00040 [bacterium]|nr:hypothetical protein [bacterium]
MFFEEPVKCPAGQAEGLFNWGADESPFNGYFTRQNFYTELVLIWKVNDLIKSAIVQ